MGGIVTQAAQCQNRERTGGGGCDRIIQKLSFDIFHFAICRLSDFGSQIPE